MSKLMIKNLFESVKDGEKDSAVGISLAHLAGTDDFSLYCTEMEPGKRVSAHYHEHGMEFYQILSGDGNIYVGEPLGDTAVNWSHPATVSAGDFFMIEEKQVHQLENSGAEKLVVVFGCANSHITTDRVIVDGFDS